MRTSLVCALRRNHLRGQLVVATRGGSRRRLQATVIEGPTELSVCKAANDVPGTQHLADVSNPTVVIPLTMFCRLLPGVSIINVYTAMVGWCLEVLRQLRATGIQASVVQFSSILQWPRLRL